MGRAKFHCVYCDRYCEDTQDARKRHSSGRNHKANVKLWYDSVQAREQRQAATTTTTTAATGTVTMAGTQLDAASTARTPAFRWEHLPPSMLPPPPETFLTCPRLDWG
ncbi:hypothetical protein ATCC90586_001241 [Pythium insidiosum]|nr:hypothetical protein ATCC90586_001241 [Pythium insidiosum]